MAKRGRLCVVPECGRRVAPGALVCAEHRATALGKELGREVAVLASSVMMLEQAEDELAKREAARTFRQEVMRGEYAALFSAKFHEMLHVAGEEESLKGEIGMLRVAMARVLTEEVNPSRMAHALAKLTFALGRAMKQEGDMSKAKEVTEDERWHIAMEQLFPPLLPENASEQDVVMFEERVSIMEEVYTMIDMRLEARGGERAVGAGEEGAGFE